ncbi:transposase mutator type, partial [mine drainage metagenome]
RRLTAEYPFVRVDALVLTVREEDCVVSKAALIASAIRADGVREILGIQIGDSESFATWNDFFRGLQARGLKGVWWVISDSHAGLVEAAR